MDDPLAVLDEQLANTLSEIRRMESALEAGELIVAGSKGQDVPNRLLAELRQHRLVLVRLIGVTADPPVEPSADPIDQIRQSWVAQHGP
jgi:hypothetical protein